MENQKELTTESVYQDFWKQTIENEDGSINLEQLKKELFDFYILLNDVPKVYEHVTGGSLTKVNTLPEHIIQYADENYREIYQPELDIEEIHELLADSYLNDGYTEQEFEEHWKNGKVTQTPSLINFSGDGWDDDYLIFNTISISYIDKD